jgi:hypothetical protein
MKSSPRDCNKNGFKKKKKKKNRKAFVQPSPIKTTGGLKYATV